MVYCGNERVLRESGHDNRSAESPGVGTLKDSLGDRPCLVLADPGLSLLRVLSLRLDLIG